MNCTRNHSQKGKLCVRRRIGLEERRNIAVLGHQAEVLCRKTLVNHRRAMARRELPVPRAEQSRQGSCTYTATKSMLVSIVAMLIATLASLPGTNGFRAYNCSNSSNPMEMYSLLDPEPCTDVAMNHGVERTLQGEIMKVKRERLIRITHCHVVESVVSQYCGWQSRAGIMRYQRFREPYTVEPAERGILC